ncbi:MAG: hypothetical protein IKD66_00625 [Solobacterium sp.]|nr:hypothetical protein [Solobacterium sp.]
MANLEKAITTQEELDAVIGERLKRAKEKYSGWTSPEDLQRIQEEHAKAIKKLEDAASETQKIIDEKDKTIAESAKYRTDLEKTRIALAAGLDVKYANRLQGENEEEWKKDAEDLAKDFAMSHSAPPLGNPDPATSKASPEDVAKKKFADWLDQFNSNNQ